MKTKITQQIINEAIEYLAYEYDTNKETITVKSISDEASIINVIDEQWIVTTNYGERQRGTIQREILSYPTNFALINI